jgi:hypothetical protein
MRRFTILSLMGLVLGAAIAAAALRNADDYWAGGLMLLTALLIGVAALGAFYHSGRRRASRLGFVVFGGGYFTLAFLGLSDRNLAKLPTSWLLNYVSQQVGPAQTFSVVYGYSTPVQAPTLITNAKPVALTATFTANTTTPYVVTQPFTAPSTSSGNPSTRWNALLPGAANIDAFSAVGHCVFALVAGLLGVVVAQRYQAKHEQDDQRTRNDQRTGDPASVGEG